jgi:uncharacterized protein with GYD domain
MPIYLWQAAYTAESIAAQIKDPRDRLETVGRTLIEAAGGKLVTGGFSFGEYDVAVVYEAPDDVAAAAIALGAASLGAVKAAKTTKLLSGAEWVQALRKARSIGGAYRPAR